MNASPTTAPRPLLVRLLLSPDEPRLRLLWRLVLHFLLMIILFMVLSLPGSLLESLGLIPGRIVYLLNMSVIALAVTGATFVARRRLDKRTVPSLGLRIDRQAGQDLLGGILLAGLMMGGIFAVLSLSGWLHVVSFAWQRMPLAAVLGGMFELLFVFILVGWYEELVFRGYWLQNLADGTNLPFAVLFTSSIFAVGHLGNPNASWMIVTGIIAAGLLFAFAYLHTRSLWLPVGLHIGWNFFQGVVFGFPVSGVGGFSLIRHTVTGPEIITGGAFGPEAGLILMPVVAAGAVVIWLWKRPMRKNVTGET